MTVSELEARLGCTLDEYADKFDQYADQVEREANRSHRRRDRPGRLLDLECAERMRELATRARVGTP